MKKFISRSYARRLLVMAAGIVLMGFGISLSVCAGFGTDPATCLNLGISSQLHMKLGVWQLVSNAILFLIPLLFSRHLIGAGTLVNMVCVGFLVDFFSPLVRQALPQPHLAVRFLLMAAGILILGFSAAMYMEPNIGISPYDCLAYVLAERLPILEFRWWRIIQDVAAVMVGWLCGSVVGMGTVITAFCMGPFIAAFGKIIRKWFLLPETA